MKVSYLPAIDIFVSADYINNMICQKKNILKLSYKNYKFSSVRVVQFVEVMRVRNKEVSVP